MSNVAVFVSGFGPAADTLDAAPEPGTFTLLALRAQVRNNVLSLTRRVPEAINRDPTC